mmetsp:Transcript_7339/g.13808  ORF Transcript_7339/g.13808 Transcript_7339/m.13808 type:complete len:243 (-) Transcript_7339:836-1564(-)
MSGVGGAAMYWVRARCCGQEGGKASHASPHGKVGLGRRRAGLAVQLAVLVLMGGSGSQRRERGAVVLQRLRLLRQALLDHFREQQLDGVPQRRVDRASEVFRNLLAALGAYRPGERGGCQAGAAERVPAGSGAGAQANLETHRARQLLLHLGHGHSPVRGGGMRRGAGLVPQVLLHLLRLQRLLRVHARHPHAAARQVLQRVLAGVARVAAPPAWARRRAREPFVNWIGFKTPSCSLLRLNF